MKSNNNLKPLCIGIGLVALDIVINGNTNTPSKIYAGGSCGNVLTILSFLHWDTYPIARLKQNEATKRLISDLNIWNVKTSLISQTPDGSTPIIIQKNKKDKNGSPVHTFHFKNPDNKEWLPAYKPLLANKVETLTKISPTPSVFYFDRIHRSSIALAKYYKEKGAIIYFEPSSISDEKQFEECLNLADIIKFSSERINNYSTLFPIQRVPLEIETLGNKGIRYRFSHQLKAKVWKIIPSYEISLFVDTAGSGDWFSAGVISKIGRTGKEGFNTLKAESIEIVLKYGQALGALNCFFDGARGLMYSHNNVQLDSLVKKIQNSKGPISIINKKEDCKHFTKLNIASLY